MIGVINEKIDILDKIFPPINVAVNITQSRKIWNYYGNEEKYVTKPIQGENINWK